MPIFINIWWHERSKFDFFGFLAPDPFEIFNFENSLLKQDFFNSGTLSPFDFKFGPRVLYWKDSQHM